MDKKIPLNDLSLFHRKYLDSFKKLQKPFKYIHFHEAYLSKLVGHMQNHSHYHRCTGTQRLQPRLSSLCRTGGTGVGCGASRLGRQVGGEGMLQGSAASCSWVLSTRAQPRPTHILWAPGQRFCPLDQTSAQEEAWVWGWCQHSHSHSRHIPTQ